MTKQSFVMSALVIALFVPAGFAWAADPEPAKAQQQAQIYGSQLMTPQERADYRSKMRTAKTAGEREQFRKDHHEQMKERAKSRGVTLPDDPPARGSGMGSGGGGMGPGGGRAR